MIARLTPREHENRDPAVTTNCNAGTRHSRKSKRKPLLSKPCRHASRDRRIKSVDSERHGHFTCRLEMQVCKCRSRMNLSSHAHSTASATPYIARLVRFCLPPPIPTKTRLSTLAAAAARSALHTLALADRDRRFGVGGCGSHAFLDLSSHGKESLLDVGSTLCGSLEEGDAEAVCEFLQYL